MPRDRSKPSPSSLSVRTAISAAPARLAGRGPASRRGFLPGLLLLALFLSGCGYNNLQTLDEGVKASWSEVLNQYKRRSDLIPNLVNVVKGYAAHEQKVLIDVTQARSRVGSVQLTPEQLEDPEAMAKFQQAQGQMTSALSRLLVVAENYPNLKADQNFRDLQAQLEGTENRITVARQRYIESVQQYNVTVRSFPTLITAKIFGMKPKSGFTVADEAAISDAPAVDFSAPPAVPGPTSAPAPGSAPQTGTTTGPSSAPTGSAVPGAAGGAGLGGNPPATPSAAPTGAAPPAPNASPTSGGFAPPYGTPSGGSGLSDPNATPSSGARNGY